MKRQGWYVRSPGLPEFKAHYIRHFNTEVKVGLCGFRFSRSSPLRVNAFLGSSGYQPCKKCYERVGRSFQKRPDFFVL